MDELREAAIDKLLSLLKPEARELYEKEQRRAGGKRRMKCENCGKEAICYGCHPTNEIHVEAAWCIDCIHAPPNEVQP